jgi:hypothetical protein
MLNPDVGGQQPPVVRIEGTSPRNGVAVLTRDRVLSGPATGRPQGPIDGNDGLLRNRARGNDRGRPHIAGKQ